MPTPAKLILEDGTVFHGYSFGAKRSSSGEAVFQTGMVGYPEALTDPSYRGQILCFTYPLIGNYGVPSEKEVDHNGIPLYFESYEIHTAGVVVSSFTEKHSHWKAESSFDSWLKRNNVSGIYDIDTRQLTQIIREKGTMLAKIVVDSELSFYDLNQTNLVAQVSIKEPIIYRPPLGNTLCHILMVDCGIKYNQIRCFLNRQAQITLVPWDYDFSSPETLQNIDGIFLSNGPGDPSMCEITIHHIKNILEAAEKRDSSRVTPMFGICLGHQLLSLAAGFETFKMKYGNRGHNVPCLELTSGHCYITSQNHGYAVDTSSKKIPHWQPLYVNLNDQTNEGICNDRFPFFSVQFHPEASAGPHDTEFLFDLFLDIVQTNKSTQSASNYVSAWDIFLNYKKPKIPKSIEEDGRHIRKVLLLGSGGLSIGQAGEFDYSGTQALKALKEEGIKTVLVNPNIATVQTSRGMADKVYFLPINPESVAKVIRNERPDGILVTFGGQTALNCGIKLHQSGIFEEYGVSVLGTPIETILDTEDRERFNLRLSEIGEPFAHSIACSSLDATLKAAKEIGYPVILRAAFALGGLGSGFANDAEELTNLASRAFSTSDQVLIEKSMKGWKEIEYEVVRDAYDHCITVCNMENFDPLGIHTGESIVVAPSQTLDDYEYHMLRDSAMKTIRHLGVVGECNIQFALNPNSRQYCIIEVNARLSRSSALASKATGYPLAFVAAKLALGIPLTQIRNSITQSTTACFEPSLDYIVVKMPRWDLKKFTRVSKLLGSSMKSVGEVMAIGRNFCEAIQKAIRCVKENYVFGLDSSVVPYTTEEMSNPTDERIFAIANGLANGITVDKIHQLTHIDRWFLNHLESIILLEKHLQKVASNGQSLQELDLWYAKSLGMSDKHIAKCIGETELVIRSLRMQLQVKPLVKRIDTVAAEFPAVTNYLYTTYVNGRGYNLSKEMQKNDVAFDREGIMVLGSGAYRIGSSVEFDWCAVSAVRTLRNQHIYSVMVNHNPETVSTDYDECDRLYFEELSLERVLDIYELEKATGVIVSMGGQIPNNIAMQLHRQHARILGTTPEMIDGAENRYKFSRMLDRLQVDQPEWKELTSLEDAKAFCLKVGYPCLVRPSYVLSGAAMNVAHKPEDLESYLTEAAKVSLDSPVVISKFILEAKEIEVDAVANKGELIMHVITEHVENAGVHSGDATLILPPQDLDEITVRKVEEATMKVANALNVTGPMNIQFIAKNNEIKVIECNLRASRSFPFVSKTLGIDLAKMATKIMIGKSVKPYPVHVNSVQLVGVKVPQFSFTRLLGADPILGVEMASTGEVACYGATREEAYLKGYLATGQRLPKRNICLSIGPYKEKLEFLSCANKLVEMGFHLFSTPGTAEFLSEHGIPSTVVIWPKNEEYARDVERNILEVMKEKAIDLFINLPSNNQYRRLASFLSPGYLSRRAAVDFSVPLITNVKCAKLFVNALYTLGGRNVYLPLQPYDARFSSRVITLSGFISFNTPIDENQSISSIMEQGLEGGFTTICLHATRGLYDSQDLDSLKSQIDSNFYGIATNYTIYVDAHRDNIHTISCLFKSSAGLYLKISDSSFWWWKHLENWPNNSPILVEATGLVLASILFGSVIHGSRPLHITQVCKKEDMEIIRAAKNKGMAITCDVSIVHLYGNNMDASDREALWENLDIIDVVCGPLNQTISLLLASVQEGRLGISWVESRLVDNPRRILGLSPSIGTFVEVNLDTCWTEQNSSSPFYGQMCRGVVQRTVIHNEIVYLDGKMLCKGQRIGKDVRIQDKASSENIHPSVGLSTSYPMKERRGAASVPPLDREDNLTPLIGKEKHLPTETTDSIPLNSQTQSSTYIYSPTAQKPSFTIQDEKWDLSYSSSMPKTQPSWKTTFPSSLMPTRNVDAIETLNGYGNGWLAGNHILSVAQFTRQQLHALFNVAYEMRQMVQRVGYYDLLKGKVMATLFYEPSTRTCSSFAAAMQRLGGSVLPIQEMSHSSVAKGESLSDTVRTVSCYSDIIVIRHFEKGAAQTAASVAGKPVINAGDGIGEHPTQALLDIFTIREELGTVNGLTITFVGDLKNGRTVHSLALLLCLYHVRIRYVSPESLRMPEDVLEKIASKGIDQREYHDLQQIISETDVLYVTRIQKERFSSPQEYEKCQQGYIITPKLLTRAKEHMIVMHPLPRVQEISTQVDQDPRAVYFRQMEYGMYVRMALIAMILG
ncbi:Protein PYR1-3, partial [Galdieria sulphuraria]